MFLHIMQNYCKFSYNVPETHMSPCEKIWKTIWDDISTLRAEKLTEIFKIILWTYNKENQIHT